MGPVGRCVAQGSESALPMARASGACGGGSAVGVRDRPRPTKNKGAEPPRCPVLLDPRRGVEDLRRQRAAIPDQAAQAGPLGARLHLPNSFQLHFIALQRSTPAPQMLSPRSALAPFSAALHSNPS
ncbi:MAG: hypothetical protein BJ554DRAFT_5141 [Olpidium bornovanus]|uniref:Uncharacterized protein n=1 Tax=Olpidium bornovanus TaxID=278681 RepID=A0A8H7ZZY7_9FUNG|nr:MAG: hypothetical protein BJ554DRAFT_5141 [Olpidium bornovanus]